MSSEGDLEKHQLVEYVTDDSTKCSAQTKEKFHKICGVCGDVAKSNHFGSLCCDSCKAFFRRSVQSQSWESFLCIRDGECEITKDSRSCQACRYEVCKKIGMDPSLVMTQEERKAWMHRKLEKRKQQLLKNNQLKLLQAKQAAEDKQANKTGNAVQSQDERLSGETVMEWNQTDAADVEAEDDQVVTDYQDGDHNDDCIIIETLCPKDCEKIKDLQKKLRVALTFPAFPQHYYEEGADVHEHLFFVFCKGMGKFFSLIPEFRDLEGSDRRALLKDAVAKAIFIFGAHQFQEEFECWPRRLLFATCSFPTVSLASTEGFIDNAETFSKMRIFMRKYCKFFGDEIVMLLSMAMLAFDDEDSRSLKCPLKVSHGKEIYTHILETYLQHQNSTMSLMLFRNELLVCFEEVRELKESFQRGNPNQTESDTMSQEQRGNSPFASSLSDLRENSKMPPKKAFSERVRVRENLSSPDILWEKNVTSNRHSHHHFHRVTHQTINRDQERMNQGMPRNEYLDHDYQKSESVSYQPVSQHMKDRLAMEEDEVQVIIDKGSSPSGVRRKSSIPYNIMDSDAIPRTVIPDNDEVLSESVNAGKCPNEASQQTSPAFLTPIGEYRERPKSVRQRLLLHSRELPTDYSKCQPSYHVPIPNEKETSSTSKDINEQSYETYTPSVRERISLPYYEVGSHKHQVSREMSSSLPGQFQHSQHHSHTLVATPNYSSTGSMGLFDRSQLRGHSHQTYQESLTDSMQHRQAFHENQTSSHSFHMGPFSYSSNPGCVTSNSQATAIEFPYPVPPTTQSPLTTICSNMDHLSTQDDTQLVQAVQNVLPPRLMNHLVKRLRMNQREQL